MPDFVAVLSVFGLVYTRLDEIAPSTPASFPAMFPHITGEAGNIRAIAYAFSGHAPT